MSHWTENHIRHEGQEFIAYDEAGLEYGRYETHDEARDALVVYSANQLKE